MSKFILSIYAQIDYELSVRVLKFTLFICMLVFPSHFSECCQDIDILIHGKKHRTSLRFPKIVSE